MPRVLSETILRLGEATSLVPLPVQRQTIHDWATRGLKAPDGRRIKLESARVGARIVTSREALDRFLAAMNPAGG